MYMHKHLAASWGFGKVDHAGLLCCSLSLNFKKTANAGSVHVITFAARWLELEA
jgi:hypothetical protein